MAGAKGRAERQRARKESRQKRLIVVLVPVLVALLAVQAPKVLGQRGQPPAPSAPQAAAPQPGAGEGPGAPVASLADALATDTDIPLEPGEGQLVSFSRFQARDPFEQLVVNEPVPSDPGPVPVETGPADPLPLPPPVEDDAGPASVTLTVNGHREVHGEGDSFPDDDPAFRIVSIGSDSIVIGLTDGSFDGGDETITVDLGASVTLVSQPDGARFTITVVAIG